MTNTISSGDIMGTEIEIIRKRYFIDYTSKSEKHFSDEYTLYCISDNEEGVDNIFLKIPLVLPNLRIFDADGEELPLITNKLLVALLNKNIKDATNDAVKTRLSKILDDVDTRKYFVLWIKIPSSKRMHKGDAKVITLEYDAKQDDLNADTHIQELKSEQYEVFYVIKPPQDYEITNTDFLIYDSNGNKLKRHEKVWENKKGEPIYFDDKHRIISIRVRPEIIDEIIISYSFKAQRSIVSLPNITLYFLILSSVCTFILNSIFTELFNICWGFLCVNLENIHAKNAEINIGIIGSSLIIAGLIHNHNIRDSIKWKFFIPIIIATITLFLRI